MQRHQLPGQPIHIRVAGDHVMVMFERIPWQLRCEDVASAISAFSNNDWPYFHKLWWDRHQHLNQASDKLALLVPHLSPNELFSANRIISLGSFLGFYGSWDLVEMEQDYQRLALMPYLNEWPAEGMGTVHVDGQAPSAAWPGHLWQHAIQTASHQPSAVLCGNLSNFRSQSATADM